MSPRLLSVLLLLTAACETVTPAPPPRPADGCAATGICPEGLRCVEVGCIGDLAPEWPVRVRIIPPAGTALSPVELDGQLQFEDGPLLQLSTPIVMPQRLAATAKLRADEQFLSGQMTARPLGGIDEQSLTVTAAPSHAGGQTTFTFDIAAYWPTQDGGQRTITYDLQAFPTRLPPWWKTSADFSPFSPNFIIQLPSTAPEDLAHIHGVIRLPEGGSPLRDLNVTAYDDGRRVASLAKTNEQGEFEIALWAEPQDRTVELTVSSSDADRPLPRLTIPVELPGGPSTIELDPDFGQIGTTFEISGQVGSDDRPVVGALIRFTGQIGAGRFVTSVNTEANGRFTARIYPGEYDILVEPPQDPDNPLRLTLLHQALGPDSGELVLSPAPRTRVIGTVLDIAGRPLTQGTVSAELLDPAFDGMTSGAISSRIVVAELDNLGTFQLNLDRGRHQLVITPGALTGLPILIGEISVVGSATVVVDTMTIPAGAVITLGLQTQTGEPLPDMTVEVWRVDDTPTRLATRQTDAQGNAALVIPVTP